MKKQKHTQIPPLYRQNCPETSLLMASYAKLKSVHQRHMNRSKAQRTIVVYTEKNFEEDQMRLHLEVGEDLDISLRPPIYCCLTIPMHANW